jgi:hypothetical protein
MKQDTSTYSEAIEKVLLKNHYVASLKKIYKEIPKYRPLTGKTPFNTIQERVQRDPKFTRIGLGVYALTEYLDKLPKVVPPTSENEKKERLHARIQGMLIEIGNSREQVQDTYTPNKNWIFENKKLESLTTVKNVPKFTFEEIITHTVRYFDVIWFNERRFPLKVFEVEYSTNFRDALIKFVELQDFRVEFCCVSFDKRENQFQREVNRNAFRALQGRCEFKTFEQVENDYELARRRTYL